MTSLQRFLVVLAMIAFAPVVAADEFTLNIPAQPLPTALGELKAQTKVQYLLLVDLPATTVGPLLGSYTLDAAFDLLLAGTGITQQRVNDHSYILKVAPSDGVAQGIDETEATQESAQSRSSSEIPFQEVVVTARRPPDGTSTAAPVTVFSREDIEELGANSVGELLDYSAQQTFAIEGRYSTGAQYAELRGLGLGTTLILIDGRRVVPTAGDWSGSVDLSGIPISAVDRIEVIRDPDSAASSARAPGGILNIILKKQIPAPLLELQYGRSVTGDDERKIVLATGTKTERLTSTFVLEYFDHESLLGANFELARDQDFRRFGGTDYRVATSSPGNIRSLTGEPLPGLEYHYAAVPAADDGSVSWQDFVSTAGHLNLDSLYRYVSLRPAVERRSATGTFEYKLPTLTAFAEVFCVEREITQQTYPATLSAQLVPASHPFNPFGIPVSVDALMTDLGPRRTETHSLLCRPVLGIGGERASWHWDLSATKSLERRSTEWHNDLDQHRVAAALNQSDPSLTLNVFHPGPMASSEVLASLVRGPAEDRYSAKGTMLIASAHGPMMLTPWGKVSARVGAEWEQTTTSFAVLSRQEMYAAFAQLSIPLPAKTQLTIGSRFDHVDDIGGMINPLYSVTWQPNKLVALHASYRTSFRLPSVPDRTWPRTLIRMPVSDPRRNGEVDIVSIVIGGNPYLDPTMVASWAADITLTPSNLPVQLSASYWRIKASDRITAPSIAKVLAHESSLSDRVVRAEPGSRDVLVGQPGALQFLDVTSINGGMLDTSGLDLTGSHNVETAFGRLMGSLSVTLMERFTTADVPGEQPKDRVGIASTSGTVPSWRAVASIRWTYEFAKLGIVMRYVPSYLDVDSLERSTRVIPAHTLVDAQATIDLNPLFDAKSLLAGTKVTLGTQNLFDQEPQFAHIGGPLGYDPSQAGVQRRLIYLKLSHEF